MATALLFGLILFFFPVKQFISVEPDVAVRKPLKELDAFVVATDGLWHHVASDMAIQIVRKAKNCETACERLYKLLESEIRGGRNHTFGVDNTMICVGKIRLGSQPESCPRVQIVRKRKEKMEASEAQPKEQ